MFEMLNKTKIFLKSFFESTYFLILISVLTIINYQFNLGVITYNVTALFLILMVISKSNFVSLPSIFIFVLGGGLTGLPNFKSFWFILFCILAVLLLCVLVIAIIKNKDKIKPNLIHNSFFVTTIILIITMFLSLITSVDCLKTLGAIGGFSLNIIVMMFVLLTTDKTNDNRKKLGNSFMCVTLVIFAMMMFKLNEWLKILPFKQILIEKRLQLKWANTNHYVVISNFGVVISLVLLQEYIKNKKYMNIVLSAITIVLGISIDVLVFSRGSIIGLGCSLIVGAIIDVCKNYHNKKKIIVYCSLAISLIGIVLVLYFKGVFDYLFNHYNGNQLTGRGEIWVVAWKHFKENWLLGTGYGTQRIFIMSETSHTVYNYHNCFLQISTCGIIGIIAFILYLVNICFNIYKINKTYNIFMIMLFVMFMVTGSVDTLFFSNKIMPLFSICLCYIDLKPKERSLENQWKEKLNIIN